MDGRAEHQEPRRDDPHARSRVRARDVTARDRNVTRRLPPSHFVLRRARPSFSGGKPLSLRCLQPIRHHPCHAPSAWFRSQAAVKIWSLRAANMSSLSGSRDTAATADVGYATRSLMRHQPCQALFWTPCAHAAV